MRAYTPPVLRLMAPAAIVCAVILCAATATPALAQLIAVRPDGSVDRAAEWIDAVLAHAPGAADDAATRIHAWSWDMIRNVHPELASVRLLMRDPAAKQFPMPIDFDRGKFEEIRYSRGERETLERAGARITSRGLTDIDFIARALVLHSDIAILGGGTGNVMRYVDGGQMEADFRKANQWRVAHSLVQLLSRYAGRDADLVLWYRATIAWMAGVQTWDIAHVNAAVSRFPDDANLQYLAGCLHETLAAPRTQASLAASRLPGGVTLGVGSASGELKDAASRLQRALALNPQQLEARLHYGRVLTLTGRSADAIPVLRPVAAQARDPELRYLAQIFLGAAFQAAHDSSSARLAYHAALTLFPQAQVPHLGLSALAALEGNRPDARDALAPMLSGPQNAVLDPWWTYVSSCGRDYAALLNQVRQRLTAASSR